MLETDSLRKVLYAKAILATNSISMPCQIGSEPFTPPTDDTVYGNFWFRPGLTKIMDLGGRGSYECTPGLIQFTLFAPEKSGDGPIMKTADQLKRMFNRQQWPVPPDGYVNMHVFGVSIMPGNPNGNRTVVVDGSYDFYHRDPNPSTALG